VLRNSPFSSVLNPKPKTYKKIVKKR